MFNRLKSRLEHFSLNQTGGLYVFLLVLLLLPTLWLLNASGSADASLSTLIGKAWSLFLKADTLGIAHREARLLGDMLSFSVIVGLAILYLVGLKKLWNIPADTPESKRLSQVLLLWPIIFGLVVVWVIPFHSRDIYGYINRGAEQAFYGLNPYQITVGEIPHWQADPIFQSHWLDNPCPYGFFYAQLANLLTHLGGHSFFLTFLIFKGFNVLVFLTTLLLMLSIARELKLPRPWLLVYLYGWNPLVLMHLLANGHNDGLMALLMLGCIWCLLKPRWQWAALPVLMLSVLTKYASLLLMPLVVLYMIRQKRWSALLLGAAITAVLTGVLAWPYIQDWQHLPFDRMSENAAKSQHSLNALFSRLLYYTVGPFVGDSKMLLEQARMFFKWVFMALYGIWYIWLMVRMIRKRERLTVAQVLYGGTMALLVFLTLASAKFHGWYLGMALPLVFLLDTSVPTQRRVFLWGFLLSLFQLLAFTPLENIHIIGVLLTIVLPLALAWWPNPRLIQRLGSLV